MKVTQTIQLQYDEKLAIEKVLGLCDEISDLANCSMRDVFDYFAGEAEIIDEYKYSMHNNVLQIAEIG